MDIIRIDILNYKKKYCSKLSVNIFLMLTYISNSDHYKEVLSRVTHVKHFLRIGTADIKDLYIKDRNLMRLASLQYDFS